MAEHRKISFDAYAEDDQNLSVVKKELADTSTSTAIRYSLKQAAEKIRRDRRAGKGPAAR